MRLLFRCTHTFFFITFNFVGNNGFNFRKQRKSKQQKKMFKSQSNNPAPCRYVCKYLVHTKLGLIPSNAFQLPIQLFYANSNSYQFRVYFFSACIISNTTFRLLNSFRQFTISENGPYLLTLIFERRLFTWLNIGDMVVF